MMLYLFNTVSNNSSGEKTFFLGWQIDHAFRLDEAPEIREGGLCATFPSLELHVQVLFCVSI